MFLDDELEAIYREKGFGKETTLALVQACMKRVPKYNGANTREFISAIKQMDGGWRLFCKRHPEFNPDGLCNCYCSQVNLSKEAMALFGWK